MRSDIAVATLCIMATIVATSGGKGGLGFADRSAASKGAVYAATADVKAGTDTELSPYHSGWYKEIRIAAGRDRQFHLTAGVNRQPTSFLVDTGAAFVALRESDAKAANIFAERKDFRVPVSTANGITHAAKVTIKQIEISGLQVANVEAFILPDEKLHTNLLGMSFLSHIKSVEARGNELILRG